MNHDDRKFLESCGIDSEPGQPRLPFWGRSEHRQRFDLDTYQRFFWESGGMCPVCGGRPTTPDPYRYDFACRCGLVRATLDFSGGGAAPVDDDDVPF